VREIRRESTVFGANISQAATTEQKLPEQANGVQLTGYPAAAWRNVSIHRSAKPPETLCCKALPQKCFEPEGPCCTDHLQLGTRPTRDGIQAVRSKLGWPSPVILLKTRTPILASFFWFF